MIATKYKGQDLKVLNHQEPTSSSTSPGPVPKTGPLQNKTQLSPELNMGSSGYSAWLVCLIQSCWTKITPTKDGNSGENPGGVWIQYIAKN